MSDYCGENKLAKDSAKSAAKALSTSPFDLCSCEMALCLGKPADTIRCMDDSGKDGGEGGSSPVVSLYSCSD